MTTALLVLLNIQFALLLVVYALPEKRSATRYRGLHMEIRKDELFYSDLLARLQLQRNGRRDRPVFASRGAEDPESGEERGGEDVEAVTHSGSVTGGPDGE